MSLVTRSLASDDSKAGTRRSIGLVHGFTQNASCLVGFGQAVATATQSTGWESDVLLVDAPGHGASGHDDADLVDAARLIVETGGRRHWIGYSMGGRMLLHAALLYPEAFESLVLIGATPGIVDPKERADRIRSDERLALRIERQGLPAFLDHWLSLDLFATLPAEAACREDRLTNRGDGLAASLRCCGTGSQSPLWRHLPSIDTPMLVLAGAADAKFSAIGAEMAEQLPNGDFRTNPGGHAVHSEDPARVAELIAEFQAGV